MKKIATNLFFELLFRLTITIIQHSRLRLLSCFWIVLIKARFINSNDIKNAPGSSFLKSFQRFSTKLNSQPFLIIFELMGHPIERKPSVALDDHEALNILPAK
jgi:hypothetical protein